jgi:hypothetical protein
MVDPGAQRLVLFLRLLHMTRVRIESQESTLRVHS